MPEFTRSKCYMALLVTTQHKHYELPDEGEHLAVLADVVDLGEVDTEYGKKDRVRFIWLVQQRDSDGKHIAVAYSYNKSLYEKANLRNAVKVITGRDPGDSCDLETLLGSNVRLVIEHYTHDGRSFAGIAAMLWPRKGETAFAVPADFIRAKDRNSVGSGGNSNPPAATGPGIVPHQGGPAPNEAATKQPNRAQSRTSLSAASAPAVKNIHGVDVTDSDVQFPGDGD
jgi:hypothetical protein